MSTLDLVYPVYAAGCYHWPISGTSLDGLYSRCGRHRLDGDLGRPPGDVDWSEQCKSVACRRQYDLARAHEDGGRDR